MDTFGAQDGSIRAILTYGVESGQRMKVELADSASSGGQVMYWKLPSLQGSKCLGRDMLTIWPITWLKKQLVHAKSHKP